MSTSMKQNVFKAFWKFCFCSPHDELCMKNCFKNRIVLQIICEENDDYLDYIKNDKFYDHMPVDEKCCYNLCIFISGNPRIYGLMSADTQKQIKNMIQNNDEIKLVSWFVSGNKTEHINKMIEERVFSDITSDEARYIMSVYEMEGLLPKWINYCISSFKSAASFDSADAKYNNLIAPLLSKLERRDFIELISAINSNDQIYGRRLAYNSNCEIIESAVAYLGNDFDFSLYPHFLFDSTLLLEGKSNSEKNIF